MLLSIITYALAFAAGFLVSRLVDIKVEKGKPEEYLPQYEQVARAYEESAKALMVEARGCAATGYHSLAERELEKAQEFFDKAKQLRDSALSDIMEGKI